MVNNQAERFGYGSISVPVSLQNLSSDSIFSAIKTVSGLTGIYFFSIQSGFNTEGIDLGSNYMRTIKKPEVVMLVGGGHFMNRTGASPTEAGEVWHLLDQRLQMSITKMEISNLPGANLNRYNVMVMVTGFYNGMDKASTDKIKTWVQNGGCLITFKTATEWAIRQGLTKEKIIPPFDTSKTTQPKRFNFDNAVEIEGAQSLGGSIFSIDLDTTHPIGFGFTSRKVSVYKNGLTYLMPSSNPYSTVAQFTNNPLVGGYVHSTTLKKLSNSAAIIVAQEGNGKLIMFTDNPNFRGTWYGTNKLFLNALFYGPIITVPEVR